MQKNAKQGGRFKIDFINSPPNVWEKQISLIENRDQTQLFLIGWERQYFEELSSIKDNIGDFLWEFQSQDLILHDLKNNFELLSTFSELKKFYLNFSKKWISSFLLLQFAKFIPKAPKLKELYINFQETCIYLDGLNDVLTQLGQLQELKILDIELRGSKIIEEKIPDATKQERELIGVKQYEMKLNAIFDSIKQGTRLQELYIGLDNIGLCHSPNLEALSHCPLKQLHLDFNNNQLTNDHVDSIFEQLSELDSLVQLEISVRNNQFNQDGIQKISEHLGKMDFLRQLELYIGKNQHINRAALLALAMGISQLRELNFLFFSIDNCGNGETDLLTQEDFSQIGQSLAGMNKLKCINFSCGPVQSGQDQGGMHIQGKLCASAFSNCFTDFMAKIILYFKYFDNATSIDYKIVKGTQGMQFEDRQDVGSNARLVYGNR